MRPSPAWKAFEDRCSIALGGRRVLGNRGSGVPDSDDDVPFALECKLGYGKFQLRDKWISQARRNAKASGKPWAIVQKPKYVQRAVVSLDFDTFVAILRSTQREDEHELQDDHPERGDQAAADR